MITLIVFRCAVCGVTIWRILPGTIKSKASLGGVWHCGRLSHELIDTEAPVDAKE